MNSAQAKSGPMLGSMAKAKRGDRFYVKNSELHDEIEKWYKQNTEQIPDKVTLAIMQICERLARKGNFVNYTYREDMVASALVVCIRAVQEKKYRLDAPQKNPFAYFTQIAYNEMVRIIKLEKVHSYIKHKALDHYITDSMLAGEHVDVPLFEHGDRNYDLIRYFESGNQSQETDSVVSNEEVGES